MKAEGGVICAEDGIGATAKRGTVLVEGDQNGSECRAAILRSETFYLAYRPESRRRNDRNRQSFGLCVL